MNNIFTKLKRLNLSKKQTAFVIIGIIVFIIMVAGELLGSSTEVVSSTGESINSEEYIKNTEKELENIIGDIQGAGKVKVMITLESCYENVYATGSNVKTDEEADASKAEYQEEYIVLKNGSNNEECLVIKVFEPTIKGVAVVAQGADNPTVKNAILQTVCALFDISSAKVSVEKMQNN